jgi:hypothetical protein
MCMRVRRITVVIVTLLAPLGCFTSAAMAASHRHHKRRPVHRVPAHPTNGLTRAAQIVAGWDESAASGPRQPVPPQVVVRRCGWLSLKVARCVAYVVIFEAQNTYDPTPPYFDASCPYSGNYVDPHCDSNTTDDNTPIPGSYSGSVCNASAVVDFSPPLSRYATGPSECLGFADTLATNNSVTTSSEAIQQLETDQDQPDFFVTS